MYHPYRFDKKRPITETTAECLDRIVEIYRDDTAHVVAYAGVAYHLTPCCDASATGSMGSIVCRSCFREVCSRYGMGWALPNEHADEFLPGRLMRVGLRYQLTPTQILHELRVPRSPTGYQLVLEHLSLHARWIVAYIPRCPCRCFADRGVR